MAESHPSDLIGLDSNRVRSILLTIEEGIQVWDTDGVLVYANPATLAQLGDDGAPCVGRHWRWLASLSMPSGNDDRFPVGQVLAGAPSPEPALLQIGTEASGARWLRVNAHPLVDARGCITGAVSSSVDITQLVEQEQCLKRQVHFDTLTGLPNRTLFSDRLDQALAHTRRHGQNLAVCLLDLDGFKAVNDILGHPAGDQLLREVAARLHDTLRGDDTAARLGGDEFALLIGDLKTAGQCEQVIKRVLDTLGAPYLIAGAEVHVTASIGVTLFPGDTMDPDQLLRHADQAMYKAKQAGKNRFSIFDPTLESRARANQSLVRKIEQALERHEFTLHYQPKVDCRAGRVVGLEALIRWNHPVLGLRMPGEFLPLIEHEDVIVHLGDWVMEEALQQHQRLRDAGHDLVISVNIAARQLLRRQFAEQLESLLQRDGADRLEIEILETAALEDIGTVGSLITHFQQRGIRFALDDFGTGYSSLVHLKRLAANVLKIDQTFVRDVVAEGVEDMEQIRRLLELGCDVMQGYGISRPLAPERLLPWLDAFRPDPQWHIPPTTWAAGTSLRH